MGRGLADIRLSLVDTARIVVNFYPQAAAHSLLRQPGLAKAFEKPWYARRMRN
jgi:hypothetical protein